MRKRVLGLLPIEGWRNILHKDPFVFLFTLPFLLLLTIHWSFFPCPIIAFFTWGYIWNDYQEENK